MKKTINIPGNVEKSWFTSANYHEAQARRHTENRRARLHCCGRSPEGKATNMIDGTVWVDERDNSIVEIDGIASKALPSSPVPPT